METLARGCERRVLFLSEGLSAVGRALGYKIRIETRGQICVVIQGQVYQLSYPTVRSIGGLAISGEYSVHLYDLANDVT